MNSLVCLSQVMFYFLFNARLIAVPFCKKKKIIKVSDNFLISMGDRNVRA